MYITTMAHAINSNTGLLSIDYITRTHTQTRESPRGEKESWKEMRRKRDREKIKRKKEKKKKLEKKQN